MYFISSGCLEGGNGAVTREHRVLGVVTEGEGYVVVIIKRLRLGAEAKETYYLRASVEVGVLVESDERHCRSRVLYDLGV